MTWLVMTFKRLLHLPQFIRWIAVDFYFWFRDRRWEVFDKWGIHLYVGMFGAGKTSTMVHDAYRLAKQYPYITILTNFALYDFPSGVSIQPLRTVDDILTAPDNTLVLIDEIGTIFNSRDFLGKKGVPKILFQHICQCRKRHVMILGTTQRWNFLDKQLRDICATVTVSKMTFGHPFSRMASCWVYDAQQYDLAFTNPVYAPPVIGTYVYVQTDRLRNRYDTSELVDTILASSYLSDDEIAANRGEVQRVPVELSRSARRSAKRNVL